MGETTQFVDVLIVGAGLSGIGAAVHLEREAPSRTFVIVESRDTLGGTWDLFRYPNVRSDSDMYTLGYEFAPWLAKKSIADGADILTYLNDVADRFDVRSKILFSQRVVAASWSSETAKWTVTLRHSHSGDMSTIECRFLWGNTGYYRYDAGYRPHFDGEESFAGQFVHPQFWPEKLDVAGKRVAVIGSGATAMTLVPALASAGARVTMIQRSPTYVAARPDVDRLAQILMKVLPARAAYSLIRAKNVVASTLVYQLSRRRPDAIKKALREGAIERLPEGFDVDVHFAPSYNPWDQRLCLITNGDLFDRIKEGHVDMITDSIGRITLTGIVTATGREVDADIIVTATGLDVQFLGGMELLVDGESVRLGDHVAYKGIMVCDIPNLAMTFGYTNASWTLKADLTARYICRLLNEMSRQGAVAVIPQTPAGPLSDEPYIPLSAGYIQRVADQLPRQGTKRPWRLYQNYFLDWWLFRGPRLKDGLRFVKERELSSH